MAASVGFGPSWRIDGPPPLPPLYGLVQSAERPLAAPIRIIVDIDNVSYDLNDLARELSMTEEEAIKQLKADGVLEAQAGAERWISGAQVYSYPPDLADIFDPCEGGSNADTKGFGEDVALPEFGAMTVWLAETCTTRSVWDEASFRARASMVLAAVEGPGVAREFLEGRRMPLNPHLSDGNGTFPNGDVVTNPVDGLAMMEEEIAKSGRQGIIHCSPGLATSLVGRGFSLDNKSGVIRTVNGIVVVPDFGYVFGATPKASDAYPDGHAEPTGTEEWMYASGPVDIRRSDAFTNPDTYAEALDKGTPNSATTGRPNTVTYRAERYYLIDWDTEVQSAVLVDRCQTECGSAS